MTFFTGGSERVRIDTSGNVGIGTSSPTQLLDVNGNVAITGSARRITGDFSNATIASRVAFQSSTTNTQTAVAAIPNGTDTTSQFLVANNSDLNNASLMQLVALATESSLRAGITGTGTFLPITFFTGGSERVRVDTSGNVGIGTSTPSYRLTIAGNGGSGLCTLAFVDTSNANKEWRIDQSSGALRFTESGAAERMRIDSSGNLLVGDTTHPTSSDNRLAVVGTRGIDCKNTGGATAPNITSWNNATTGDNIFVSFRTETADTARGSISYNRAGGLVAYNTTSDYRAKDILGPVANPGTTIDALKVYTGKMKGATVERPMLVAHEAQEVTPYAVTGEKDASNEDGSPKYQQMDVASLVPLLIAEIQSLRARVAQLEGA
jgi:hypothetical protein